MGGGTKIVDFQKIIALKVSQKLQILDSVKYFV